MTPTVRQALAQSGLVPIDGEVLLAHACGQTRAWLVAHAADALPRAAADDFFALAKRRREGEPVAYLTGLREFWSTMLSVTSAVLIPRPETEALVEWALGRFGLERDGTVLDLGTGSGAIAIAIASERPRLQVLATDFSPAALAVAQGNAERLALSNITTLQSDWFDNIPQAQFDLIVSNPPYIAASDPHLREGDLRFEPVHALVAGADGLAALRVIVAGARQRLVPGGWLAVEHGHDQSRAVCALLLAAGFADVHAARDLSGIARVAAGRAA